MVAVNPQFAQEERIARLTDAAYRAVIERGYRGSFLELELSLWSAIRRADLRDRDGADAEEVRHG